MHKNWNIFWSKVEVFLDRFFEAQQAFFWKGVDKLFGYHYRETHSGIFGLFDTPEQISKAAKLSHQRGYTNFDCLTPFPVHGLEFDMGLKRSRIPYITFWLGLTGFLVSFCLQTLVHEQILPPVFSYFDVFPNIRSYPLNIGGKPTFSWPPMIPILFELTVLIGGHSTVIGLIVLSRLYSPFRRVLHPSITDNKFCLWIPSDSKNYSEAKVLEFMKELGAKDISLASKDETKVFEG